MQAQLALLCDIISASLALSVRPASAFELKQQAASRLRAEVSSYRFGGEWQHQSGQSGVKMVVVVVVGLLARTQEPPPSMEPVLGDVSRLPRARI
jgi:hypothetical protein